MHSACNATADPDHPSLCAIDFSSGWTSYTGGEPGYGTTIQLLRQAIGGTEARRWDADYETPYFDIAGDKIAELHDSPTQPQTAGCNRCTCEYIDICHPAVGLTRTVVPTDYVDGQNKSRSHRIYFDDPASLAIKYEWVVASGLRGVGMWTADAAIQAMGKAPRYRWHLGGILLKMPAISLLAGPRRPRDGLADGSALPVARPDVP